MSQCSSKITRQHYYKRRCQYLYTKIQWWPLTRAKASWIDLLDSDLTDSIWDVPIFWLRKSDISLIYTFASADPRDHAVWGVRLRTLLLKVGRTHKPIAMQALTLLVSRTWNILQRGKLASDQENIGSTLTSQVFWDVTPCQLINGYRGF